MNKKTIALLLSSLIPMGLCAVTAQATTFVIDDAYNDAGTYYGGMINWDTSGTSPDLRASTGDVVGDQSDYGVDSLTVTRTASTISAVIEGPFFSFTTSSANSTANNVYEILSGDLFLSSDGWTPNGTAATNYSSDYSVNGEDWEYALTLDGMAYGVTSGTVSLYEVLATGDIVYPEEVLSNVGYRTGQEYQYEAASGQTSISGVGSWYIDSTTGTLTITFALDSTTLAALGLDGEIGVHWTMTCGNDVIEGVSTGNEVPEPATLFLFGAGLAGLAGVRKRRR